MSDHDEHDRFNKHGITCEAGYAHAYMMQFVIYKFLKVPRLFERLYLTVGRLFCSSNSRRWITTKVGKTFYRHLPMTWAEPLLYIYLNETAR